MINHVDDCGIGLIRLSSIDNENMIIKDNQDQPWRVKVNIPKYWKIDEATNNELSSARL